MNVSHNTVFKSYAKLCLFNVNGFQCTYLKVVQSNKDLIQKYHPCFWEDGIWKCCQQEVKQAMGCRVVETKNGGL